MRLRLGPRRWWSGWRVTLRVGEGRLAGLIVTVAAATKQINTARPSNPSPSRPMALTRR
jgi:hypothetical protein